MFFNDATIEALAESIEEIGVLVPLTVYEERGDDGTTHVLLDGERRWRAAKLINYPEVPAWVIDKPDGIHNTLRMFNIHMLREEWSEIATAWALEALQSDLGTDNTAKLSEITGLSRDRIRNMQTVLGFPKKLQHRVADGSVPFQFLVELEKNILSKKRLHPDLLPELSEKQLQDAFLKKYEKRLAETVELRNVGRLFNTASRQGAVGERAKTALLQLVKQPEMTIDEAYETGAAASVELRRVIRDVQDLPERLSHVLKSELTAEQRTQLVQAVAKLRSSLAKLTRDGT